MVRKVLYRVIIVWAVLIVLVALLGKVTVAAPDGGRTAADFLQIGIGARAAGMGGAFTAVSSGAEATYWNPAALTELEQNQVLLGHYSWYQDINLEHGSFAFSVSDDVAVAASLTYLGYGTIEGYDASGYSTGELAAYDWAGALSLGWRISENLSVGLTGKYINQKLDDLMGSGFAADVGVKYRLDRMVFALTAANIGSGVNFESTTEELPTTVRFGLSVVPVRDMMLASLELEKKRFGSTVLRQGLEFSYQNRYFLRGGYAVGVGDGNDTYSNMLTFGAGTRFGDITADYAYTLSDDFNTGDLHRFSIGISF